MIEACLYYLSEFFDNLQRLGCTKSIDPAFFYAFIPNFSGGPRYKRLKGLILVYVDDGLWAGNISNIIDAIRKFVTFGKELPRAFVYLGSNITQTATKIVQSTEDYVVDVIKIGSRAGRRLNAEAATQFEYQQYRKALGGLDYLSLVDGVLGCPCSLLAAPVNNLTVKDLKTLNQVILDNAGTKKLEFRKLDPQDFALVGLSDSSLANAENQTAQFGGAIGMTSLASMLLK